MSKKLYKNINFNAKVKCVLCGKVGLASDSEGLIRHAELAHDKSSIKSMFIPTDEDVPIEIIGTTKKKFFRKLKEQTSNKKLKPKKQKSKSLYWGAIIKVPFEAKR